jgi:hypothetical protein
VSILLIVTASARKGHLGTYSPGLMNICPLPPPQFSSSVKQLRLGSHPSGQLFPRTIHLRTIAPDDTYPRQYPPPPRSTIPLSNNSIQTIPPEETCPLGVMHISLWLSSPPIIPPPENSPDDTYPPDNSPDKRCPPGNLP